MNVPAIVVYAPEFGKPTLRVVASNRGELGRNVWDWLTDIDITVTADAARALHTNGAHDPEGGTRVVGPDRPCCICGLTVLFDEIPDEAKLVHVALADVVVSIVKARARAVGKEAPRIAGA